MDDWAKNLMLLEVNLRIQKNSLHTLILMSSMCLETKDFMTIRRHQIFLGGSSDENEKVLGKFLARLRRAKKGVPKFFACGGLFFVVEALKTAKNR